MRVAAPVLILVIGTSSAAAQDRAADEKAIRAAVAAMDARVPGMYPTMLPDGVFWSGAFNCPRFGSQDNAVEIDHPRVKNRLRDADGRFLQKSKSTVRKVEIAQAGDMAYVVADTELTIQVKTDKATEADTFMGSSLTVWKKVDGTWRPAAQFQFAHDGSYPNPAGARAR